MPHVVVVGGGFAGLSAAARLAKLHHSVTLLEASHQLGGRLRPLERDGKQWPLHPETVTLPGVVRDLFRKSGRPLERELEMSITLGQHHLFTDKTLLALPFGDRANQHHAVNEAFGEDPWSPWVDTWDDSWNAQRREVFEKHLDGPLSREAKNQLDPKRSLAKTAKKAFKDSRLQAMLLDPILLDGGEPRATPGFVAVDHYVERTFGRWRFAGGMSALADKLAQRVELRKVEVRYGQTARALDIADGRVRAVVADVEAHPADIVIWCAPTWPEPLPRPGLMPLIPAQRLFVELDREHRQLPDDLWVHGKPPFRLFKVDPRRVVFEHHAANDPVAALAGLGIDLRPLVVHRIELPPGELVRLGHWGWQWQGWKTMFQRPGSLEPKHGLSGGDFNGSLYWAGAHAHPGASFEAIGMATSTIAETIGSARLPKARESL